MALLLSREDFIKYGTYKSLVNGDNDRIGKINGGIIVFLSFVPFLTLPALKYVSAVSGLWYSLNDFRQ